MNDITAIVENSYEKTKIDKPNDLLEETVGIYENIIRNEIENRMREEGDIPLALIPPFWQYPEALIELNASNISMLSELIECDQSVLMELFRYNDEALSEIVLLFKPLKIEFNIAHA